MLNTLIELQLGFQSNRACQIRLSLYDRGSQTFWMVMRELGRRWLGNIKEQLDNQPLAWTFFREWLKNPLKLASVTPSSQELGQNMLRELPTGSKRVIELGGGTGVFTKALLEYGIAEQDLLVIELSEAFCAHLKQTFPKVAIACADARFVKQAMQTNGFDKGGPVDAVISGLGLLSMTRADQMSILRSVFDVMRPGGHFIQFTYGPTSPANSEVLRDLGISSRRASFTMWNVPPAAVYVFTRDVESTEHMHRSSNSKSAAAG